MTSRRGYGESDPVEGVGKSELARNLFRPGVGKLASIVSRYRHQGLTEEGGRKRVGPVGDAAVVHATVDIGVGAAVERGGGQAVGIAGPLRGRRAVRVPEEQIILVVQLVIDADRLGVLLSVVEAESEPVGGHQRVVAARGQRSHAVQVPRQRTLAAGGNPVAGEGLPGPGTRVGGERIIERDPAADAIDQSAEVPLPEFGSRHRDIAGRRLAQLVALVGEEEERAVAAVVQLGDPDGAAERGAEFVAHQVRRLEVEVLAGACDAQAAVPCCVEYGSVDLIGARAGGDHEGAGAVQLGGGVVGLGAELGDGVESGRPRRDRLPLAVFEHGAVLKEFRRVAQSVDARDGARLDTRSRHVDQRRDEAAVERQLLDALTLDHGGKRRTRGGHQRRDVAGHGDRRCRGSRLQH